MQKLIFIIFSTLISICFSQTEYDLSDRISIDGLSDDYTINEHILIDLDGNLLESPVDSYWEEYNDVKQIKATWDASYLYVAVDACSWGNNVILFIDVDDSYGIQDMNLINAWQRSFKFYNINPDFFVGTWDTNDTPHFWKVKEGGSVEVQQIETSDTLSTRTAASFDTGNLSGAMEIKIPWETLNTSNSSMQSVKLLSVITSPNDYTSGPDSAPDNLGGMSNELGQMVVLDNYVEVLVDEDGDGPDIGVNPQERTSFYKQPPFESIPLLIQNVSFEGGKTFAPTKDENIVFELVTNRNVEFSVQIYDLNGKYIDTAHQINPDLLIWSWDGKNNNGKMVPFGIYILYFIASSGEVSHKEAVVVIK